MELRAKSDGELLSAHVEECLRVARNIVPSLGLDDLERQHLLEDVSLAIALHDVGKAAIGFQKVMYGETDSWKGRRHEILSASFASSIPNVKQAIIFAILTHHKSIPNGAFPEDTRALDFPSIPIEGLPRGEAWRKMEREWYANSLPFKKSWRKICGLIGRDDIVNVLTLTTPLKLDPSWLIRDVAEYAQLRAKSYAERRYFSLIRGLLISCDHMASGHHVPDIRRTSLPDTSGVLERTQVPRGFQTAMAQTKGSTLLRAPTGSGKTEAALMWVNGNRQRESRAYYVLPNIASINAMYRRLCQIYGNESVGLLHSRARGAIYRQLETGQDIASRLSDEKNAKMLASLARSIWFPIRVCTPHQILRFSLRGRGWETMLGEFPKALFIFDEIHAYDPRLVGQIIATAKLVRNWNAKSAFMSATMPDFLIRSIRHELDEGNTDKTDKPSSELRLISPDPQQDREIIAKRRHLLINHDGTLLDHLSNIISDMEHSRKVLVVCNAVKASQQVFSGLVELLYRERGRERLTEADIMLLHSRFTRRDRTEKETRIMMKETQPRILVATQVVEVSLDISYDVAYLEPAPIDATIQRMGR